MKGTLTGNKFSVIAVSGILIFFVVYLALQQEIGESIKIFIGFSLLVTCIFNYKISIIAFFFLNFFFKYYFNTNLFNIPILDPFSVISIILFYHFISRGIITKKTILDRKYLLLVSFCFISNLIFCFRYWIFDDYIVTSFLASCITNYIVFPISIIFILSQIFKSIKQEKDFNFMIYILVGIVIFSSFYLVDIYFNASAATLAGVGSAIGENELWNNALLGHKNTYGPFFVILFFSLLQFYNFDKKNRFYFLIGIIASISVVMMSLSRNAYATLIIVNAFLLWKGFLSNKKIFFALLIGGLAVFFLAGEVMTNRATSVIEPLLQGNVEGMQENTSGHFTDEAFEQVASWLIKSPFFGGFFDEYNLVESGWTELIRTQGVVGLIFYILLLFYFHRFFYAKTFSKNLSVRKYAIIGYSIIICVYLMNTTDHLIYTYSITPLTFWLSFVYLAVLWFEKNEKLSLKKNTI